MSRSIFGALRMMHRLVETIRTRQDQQEPPGAVDGVQAQLAEDFEPEGAELVDVVRRGLSPWRMTVPMMAAIASITSRLMAKRIDDTSSTASASASGGASSVQFRWCSSNFLAGASSRPPSFYWLILRRPAM
jgi:hypothetical protein